VFETEVSIGFPPGALWLGVMADQTLLGEQQRVHAAGSEYAVKPWSYFEAGRSTPHLTLAVRLSIDEVAIAVPFSLGYLPISGWLDHGGVEDDTADEKPTRAETALQQSQPVRALMVPLVHGSLSDECFGIAPSVCEVTEGGVAAPDVAELRPVVSRVTVREPVVDGVADVGRKVLGD